MKYRKLKSTISSNLIAIIVLYVLSNFLSCDRPENVSREITTEYGTDIINRYLENSVIEIAHRNQEMLSSIQTVSQWEAKREELRGQLREMLGLSPLPERTDLNATITGTVEKEGFVVEKLHFQSMPGLYVTANFYRPRDVKNPLPTVLYLCGHGGTEIDGIQYGSKVTYQKHPTWYATHGYNVLIIDTHQLGEVPGIHRGLSRLGYWEWNARGYTPLGVEIWNAMRALDYLESRPEVDMSRVASTGRSGGGVYTWYLAALDDRISVAAPTSSLADSREDVLNKMHTQCDCTKFPNTYQWDLFVTGALLAPRPLLISHTDHGQIHAIDGVQRLYREIRKIYRLYDSEEHIELLVTAGPHQDSRKLRQASFTWMNRWLKNDNQPVTDDGQDYFEPPELRVFELGEIPEKRINSDIEKRFNSVPESPAPPTDSETWQTMKEQLKQKLLRETFVNWPADPTPFYGTTPGEFVSGDIRISEREFNSQKSYRFRIWWLRDNNSKPERLIVHVADHEKISSLFEGLAAVLDHEQLETLIGPGIEAFGDLDPDIDKFRQLAESLRNENHVHAFIPPRGIGPTTWDPDLDRDIRRKFMAIGQTVDGMRVWDVRRALQVIRKQDGFDGIPMELRAENEMAGIALQAGIFEPDITRLTLTNLPVSNLQEPIFFRIVQVMDVPQAVSLVLPQTGVNLMKIDQDVFRWTGSLAGNFGWDETVIQFK